MKNAQLKEVLTKVLRAYTAFTKRQKPDRKNRYGSKSQKGTDRIKPKEKSHEEDKGDFDGTAYRMMKPRVIYPVRWGVRYFWTLTVEF